MKTEVDVLRWKWIKGCITFLLLCFILTGAGNLWAADVPHKKTASKKELSKDFFSDPKVRTFQIEIPAEGMASLQRYSRTNVHATVREGERVLTNVAIHLKGMGSFRPVDEKPSLALKFDAFEPKQEYLGLTKLMFNNSVQDPTYVAEMLATRLSRDAGLPAARVTHARVVLNGKDLGLYVVIEAMNKRFLKEHFKSAKGNLYEGYIKDIDSELELDNGEDKTQSDVHALLDTCLLTDPTERWKKLGKQLDIDKFVSFVAMEVLVGHWDGYAIHTNNYRLYHDPGTDKMVFITHGLDWAFRRPNVSIEPPLKSIVGRAVFQTPEGKKLFRERIGFLYTNVFKVEVITNRLNEAVAKLRSAGLSSTEMAKIERNADIMRERIALRGQRVEEQLRGIPLPALKFAEDGFAKLTGWRDESDRGEPIMDQVEHDGRKTLHILASSGRSRASWRTQVYLPRGRYQFLGIASSQGLSGGSAGLRISGGQRRLGISATAPWRPLSHEFEVTDDGVDVEFVCDFYSMAGEVWFDLDSLRVRRL